MCEDKLASNLHEVQVIFMVTSFIMDILAMGNKVKDLKSDNGESTPQNSFKSIEKNCGIVHKIPAPYIYKQNKCRLSWKVKERYWFILKLMSTLVTLRVTC